MVDLYIAYWQGDFYVGRFTNTSAAEKHFIDHKNRYRDYAGEKHGFPYGIPLYKEVRE